MKAYNEHLSKSAAHNLERWLREQKYADYREEIEDMIEREAWKDLEDAFFKVIEFGTAGRRGTVGPGSNRINRVTVGESTQALCDYARTDDAEAPRKGIAIACDTRLSSPELSKYAACVCAANGFKTYIFDSFRSTPELSFAVRELGCAAGIVITASHNPSSDNGFKAYWSDGAQLIPPHDKGVLAMADAVENVYAEVDFDEAVTSGKITIIPPEIDDAYIQAVLEQAMTSERDIMIAYSPLHGAGRTNTLPVLQKAGFNVIVEQDQMIPDGRFPTVEGGKSNPEAKVANDRVVALMLAEEADIAISNDPDADRFGVIVRQATGPIYLSCNQAAALGIDFMLRHMKEAGRLNDKQFIAKTIVTTDMIDEIASRFGVRTVGNLLVGFKWIAEQIRLRPNEEYLLGVEESFGMCKGAYARDKDGASPSLLLAEAAAEQKRQGKTLYDRLLELYSEYGLFVERIDTMRCEGAEGFAEMQAIMASLRSNAPTEIDGQTVTAVYDYKSGVKTDLGSGETSEINCPTGDVFVLEFGDKRRRMTVRPSGTEPILKFYNQWYEQEVMSPAMDYLRVEQRLEDMSRQLEGELFRRVEQSART